MKIFNQGSVLAVDIGGSKTIVALVNANGEIIHWRRDATSMNGPSAVIEQLLNMMHQILEEGRPEDVVAVGIGIPAVLEKKTDMVIWGPNLPGFRNVKLREALEDKLKLPVFIEYDGHTAVLGEWWQGAGRGYENVVFVIIGTGIGGGMILDGKLFRGASRLAGAAGWFTLATEIDNEDSSRQYGHWEYLASGPGILRRAQSILRSGRSSIVDPEKLTTRDVFSAARNFDPLCQEIVNETARIIGIGVANIVSLVNPEVVILGGGIGMQADLLLGKVKGVVRSQAQPISSQSVQIVASKLGERAGLLGAAYIAFDRHFSNNVE
jgi:glucokinase